MPLYKPFAAINQADLENPKITEKIFRNKTVDLTCIESVEYYNEQLTKVVMISGDTFIVHYNNLALEDTLAKLTDALGLLLVVNAN